MRTISDATSVALYELAGEGDGLICTAAAGVDPALRDVPMPTSSPLHEAVRTGEPRLVTGDVEGRAGASEAWIARGRPRSLLYQPLRRADARLGALVIGWPDTVRTPGPQATVVALLAHEAAAVISRADTLDHLSEQASTDDLTGLPNRRAWNRFLRQIGSDQRSLVLSILDLDHFKDFNDAFGHAAGDRLLKATAAAWRQQLRTGDVLARIGGEEFGLLLKDCEAGTALEVVDRLRERVTHGQTCSAGIAIRLAGETPQSALTRADAALYEAKADGRDRARLAIAEAVEPSLPAR